MWNWIEYTEPEWHGLKMDLSVDQAYLRISSKLSQSIWLYLLSKECYKCPYTRFKKIEPDKEAVTTLNVARPNSLKIFTEDVGVYGFPNETEYCKIAPDMGEFGVYNLTVNDNETCNFVTDKEPVNIYLSMLAVFIFWVLLISAVRSIFCLKNKYLVTSNSKSSEEDNKSTAKNRLKSLDAFRGMCILLMIFVNSGGGLYWWIQHAVWNGLNLADIVFPCFLWLMGVCIPISIKSKLTKGIPKIKVCRHILWRSFKLFMIGLCLNSRNKTELENIRIMGVLQNFGIAYLVCATLHTICSKFPNTPPQERLKRIFYDFIIMKVEWIIIWLLILFHLVVVFGLNVPDCPKGYLGPGGKHSMAEYPNCIGGAFGYIDRIILGRNHIYQYLAVIYVYNSKPFDHNGIFSCILKMVQVFLGVHCGVILINFPGSKSRITRWIGWSLTLALIAGILCTFSKEDGWIPLNKKLWSLSYLFLTCAIAFLLLSLCYYFIDVKGIWSGYPFVEVGMNAIIMYVGHLVLQMLPWHWHIGSMNTHFLHLLENSWNTVLWVLIALYLHKQNIFYKL